MEPLSRCHAPDDDGLFRPLINPGADQTDLLRCERFWRRAASARAALATGAAGTRRSAWAARPAGVTGGRWAVAGAAGRRTTGAARTARFALRRHGDLVIDARGGCDQQTLLALARHNHLAVVTALEGARKAVELEAGFGLLFSVASDAGRLEKRLDILVIGQALLIGGGRQLADIDFADVPFVLRGSRQGGHGNSN